MAKSVFITGAAAGIGRATALKFAAKGYTVGGYDIDEDGLASLRDEITTLGAKAITGHLDVTDNDEMTTRLTEFVAAADDRLDVLINNAGILVAGRFEQTDVALQHKMIDINCKGVINGLYAAHPICAAPRFGGGQPGLGLGDLRPGRTRGVQRHQVLRAGHDRGPGLGMGAARHPGDLDVAVVRANRHDPRHQHRHHRLAGHQSHRHRSRRGDHRGGRTVGDPPRAASGALSGGRPVKAFATGSRFSPAWLIRLLNKRLARAE